MVRHAKRNMRLTLLGARGFAGGRDLGHLVDADALRVRRLHRSSKARGCVCGCVCAVGPPASKLQHTAQLWLLAHAPFSLSLSTPFAEGAAGAQRARGLRAAHLHQCTARARHAPRTSTTYVLLTNLCVAVPSNTCSAVQATRAQVWPQLPGPAHTCRAQQRTGHDPQRATRSMQRACTKRASTVAVEAAALTKRPAPRAHRMPGGPTRTHARIGPCHARAHLSRTAPAAGPCVTGPRACQT